MEQLAHCRDRIGGRNRPCAVYCPITQAHDQPRFGKHGLTGGSLEAGLVQQSAEVVLVGQFQCRIVLVGPRYGQFQRAPRIETSGARIRTSRRFGAHGSSAYLWPLTIEEHELAHVRLPSAKSRARNKYWLT